jgi:hypothetical protein
MRPPFVSYQSPPFHPSSLSPTNSSVPTFYLDSNPQETIMPREVMS